MASRASRLLPLLLAPACAPAAYAPPARLIALDTPTTPQPGGTDLGGEIGAIGDIFGPDFTDGNVRVRHAIAGSSVVLEGETGVARETDSGSVVAVQPVARVTGGAGGSGGSGAPGTPAATGGTRDAYTGRAGVMLHGRSGAFQGTLDVGVGGGYSGTAGGWASADIGASIGGTNHWVRPWVSGELGANAPWNSRVFVVDDGQDQTALQLAPDLMARCTFGLELGPPAYTALIGISMVRIYADSNGALGPAAGPGGESYVGAALGFRARL